MRSVALTGGEVATYPEFEALLDLIVRERFPFALVTNGTAFGDRLLGPLCRPRTRKLLRLVCFSLDGATAVAHDALRGTGSWREVMEAATLCRMRGLPVGFKTLISRYNHTGLTDLALVGAALGAKRHGFLFPYPTPRLLETDSLCSPEETQALAAWVAGSLARTVKGRIHVEAWDDGATLFTCNAHRNVFVTCDGRLLFCCNLLAGAGQQGAGAQVVADLHETSLADGIARHYALLARFMAARLADGPRLEGLARIPCQWCLRYFGMLDWQARYPTSPWTLGGRSDAGRSAV